MAIYRWTNIYIYIYILCQRMSWISSFGILSNQKWTRCYDWNQTRDHVEYTSNNWNGNGLQVTSHACVIWNAPIKRNGLITTIVSTMKLNVKCQVESLELRAETYLFHRHFPTTTKTQLFHRLTQHDNVKGTFVRERERERDERSSQRDSFGFYLL